MSGPDLFYEDLYAAFRDDVQALGGSKTVGPMLWPEKDPIAARNKLNDALNPDRRERLTEEQEVLIMRRAREARGFSAALYYICDDAGFDRPKPRDPMDEAAQLQREFITAVRWLERNAPRLEAMTQPVRAVK